MAVGKDKERIYVTVSKDMLKRIDFYCKEMGLTRSAYCAHAIGQHVMSMDKALGIVDKMGDALKESVKNASE